MSERSLRRRGATLVEFAFVVPILLLMLLGIIEFGWFAQNNLQLANAVREGARDASIGLSTDRIRARIQGRASRLPGVPSKLVVTLLRDDDGELNGYNYATPLGNNPADSSGNISNNAPSGAFIQVQAVLPHQSLTGIPFSTGRTFRITVVMRRE